VESVINDRESLDEMINTILERLPENFFLREWQETIEDSTDFKELLKEQMEKAMSGSDIGRLKLFRKSG
jgi:flagellar biogenesis protein FliO